MLGKDPAIRERYSREAVLISKSMLTGYGSSDQAVRSTTWRMGYSVWTY